VPERVVEVLTFKGCPHAEPAVALAERVVAEVAVDAVVRRVDVPDMEAAVEQRFLGSPTIRLDGRDIAPAEGERDDYALSCRVYRTSAGVSGQPEEQWLRDALGRWAVSWKAAESKPMRSLRSGRLGGGVRPTVDPLASGEHASWRSTECRVTASALSRHLMRAAYDA
jgi:hypothetical protein